ncbi:hypothetical protein CesoFtcFv8_026720 [Champsocephalus esox]|uniref:Reverse transcriptase n=1 Tax=Champsocephalus esox TaxID=159716 RepID=A0AAN8G987_9TELE|nr:hypothetical protein CesoFtcFv8_026720 [Champsocephalus esox]
MTLDPDVKPVVRPVAMKDRVKAELDKMQELGAIIPVSEPTDWVSSMVATSKKDKQEIRICINPRDLNTALKRPHHPIFAGYPCEIIVDDIITAGKDVAEHDVNLRKVLNRVREVNLRLNPLKCKFRLSQVGYVGHVFTSEGLKADPSKTSAISEMPVPADVPAL